MKKTCKILILMLFCFNLVCNILVSADTVDLVVDSGSWGMDVTVDEGASPPPPGDTVDLVVDSGSWGMEIKIEYFVYGNWSNWWYMDYINFNGPTDFVVSTINDTAINLTWTKDINATHTWVERNTVSGWNRTEGIEVCNRSDSGFDDTNLGRGTLFYYRAWSYNDTQALFTLNNVTGNNYTKPGDPNDLQDTSSGMNSISFTWTKGTNATRTVVFMNATGEIGFPTWSNGTETSINDTGVSGIASGLSMNTSFWFAAYSFNPSSGFWSVGSSNDTASTLTSADAPFDLVVNRWNDAQLNLTWSKTNVSDDTVVVRKEDGYPSSPDEGVVIYNSSGESCYDTDLSPATKYYYRAWGWNSENFSDSPSNDAYNITRPSPPDDFTGDIENNNLYMTWSKGTNASHTVIKNDTGVYPFLNTGYSVYNGTGTSKTVNDVSSIDYYRGWSWKSVAGVEIFSLPTDLLWGGLEIYVYKETNPTIEIINYTVFITNTDGSETYYNTSQNNPFRIDVSDVPNGIGIAVQISKDGYHTRTKYLDLYENTGYSENFYLAPDIEGGGDENESDYIPPDDANESYGYPYVIFVQDRYGQAIEGAKVVIERFINTTDEYDSVYIKYSDSAGEVSVTLIPTVIYQVTLSKTGYETKIAEDFSPDPYYYGSNYPKKFTLIEITSYVNTLTNITVDIQPEKPDHYTNISFFYNLSCSSSDLEWMNMTVFYYNTSTSIWDTLFYSNFSVTSNDSINFTTSNATGRYALVCMFKQECFDFFTFGVPHDDFDAVYIYNIWEGSSGSNGSAIDVVMENILGQSPVYVGQVVVAYSSLIALCVAMIGFFTFSPKLSGFCVMCVGIIMGAFKQPLNLISDDAMNYTVVAILVMIGILMMIILKKED